LLGHGRRSLRASVPVDLTGLQIVQVAIDALVIPDVLPFWRDGGETSTARQLARCKAYAEKGRFPANRSPA
jgi:hypothetical protein